MLELQKASRTVGVQRMLRLNQARRFGWNRQFPRRFRELFLGVPLILFGAIRPSPETMGRRPGLAIQNFLFHDLSKQGPASRETWTELFRQAGFASIEERYLGFARTAIYTVR